MTMRATDVPRVTRPHFHRQLCDTKLLLFTESQADDYEISISGLGFGIPGPLAPSYKGDEVGSSHVDLETVVGLRFDVGC